MSGRRPDILEGPYDTGTRRRDLARIPDICAARGRGAASRPLRLLRCRRLSRLLLRADDPAFVSATLESPASWFTRGYLNYFHIYPEWGTRHTSLLLKPVTNAVGYLNYTLFGSSYALHFAVFFLMQFLGLLVFVRLLRDLDIPPLPAAGMALLFLFNPAFMNDGLICLACHFDVLAGVFALAAFLAAWRERYGIALMLLTLAVFTKESAVYAPLAAALSLMIWRRPPSMSALMMLPLPLWAAARFLAYGDVLDTGGTAQPGQIAAGLSVWPTGLVTFAFRQSTGIVASLQSP